MRNNESSYQAARRYQADHPGVSYTRAKRLAAADTPRVPLSATFNGPHGQAVDMGFDVPWVDGRLQAGPHTLLIGPGSAALLPVLADRMAAGQDPRDIEIVYSTTQSPTYRISAKHQYLTHRHLADFVNDCFKAREDLMRERKSDGIKALRVNGYRVPTTVVLMEHPDDGLVDEVNRWARRGRDCGIHFVVSGESSAAPDIENESASAEAYSAVLEAASARMHRLHWGLFHLVSVVAPERAALRADGRDEHKQHVVSRLVGEANGTESRIAYAEFTFDEPTRVSG